MDKRSGLIADTFHLDPNSSYVAQMKLKSGRAAADELRKAADAVENRIVKANDIPAKAIVNGWDANTWTNIVAGIRKAATLIEQQAAPKP